MQEIKVVFITGASSGIGEATAKRLAIDGNQILLIARRVERLKSVQSAIEAQGGKVSYYKADVTDVGRLDEVVADATDKFGRIDVLVNNAGIAPLSLVKNNRHDEACKMIDVNLKGMINTVYAVLPGMLKRGKGHIINISSLSARVVIPSTAVYSATKFGVRAFSEGLRQEFAMDGTNIRVTDIQPGSVATELGNSIKDPDVATIFKRFDGLRSLDPDDIARGVAYAIAQPAHVSVNEILIRPTFQEL
ncbi:SDR family oxidoreductase [uncultured Desulfosarcina sp.]|uniref:SDR family oxidoreductase n=1 Tax=uncultured Desulfosarcina sp. TaxID=218289 RepID=UPI0029C6E83E|nr:SDR family oxidoreductase [uncultured Desulfosarcina sp.]